MDSAIRVSKVFKICSKCSLLKFLELPIFLKLDCGCSGTDPVGNVGSKRQQQMYKN
jgi:hypothetical protein